MRLSSHDPALVAVNVNAGLAVAVLLIARMIDVGMGAGWTCAMHCMVVGVRSIARVAQPVRYSGFGCSSSVMTGVVFHFTCHDGLLCVSALTALIKAATLRTR